MNSTTGRVHLLKRRPAVLELTVESRLLELSIFRTFTQLNTDYPICRTNFRFPRRFQKSGFQCIMNSHPTFLHSTVSLCRETSTLQEVLVMAHLIIFDGSTLPCVRRLGGSVTGLIMPALIITVVNTTVINIKQSDDILRQYYSDYIIFVQIT